MYRKAVVEAYGTCTVHLESLEPDPWFPWDPFEPWFPGGENPDEGQEPGGTDQPEDEQPGSQDIMN